MRYYYYVETGTPFCGTDDITLYSSPQEIEFDEDEMREDLFQSYGYLINGWGEDEPTEEEYENFIADCTVIIKQISEEEFLQYCEEGYSISITD